MVGESVGNREIPVPFMPEIDSNEAFFPVVDGVVRDIEGNIVGEGIAQGKKEAEQKAAKDALNRYGLINGF